MKPEIAVLNGPKNSPTRPALIHDLRQEEFNGSELDICSAWIFGVSGVEYRERCLIAGDGIEDLNGYISL
jgi:hypothetical protein